MYLLLQSSTDSSLLYIDIAGRDGSKARLAIMRIAICKSMRCVWMTGVPHSGRFCFPLCHYHGVTLGFDLDIAVPALKDFFWRIFC